MNVPDCSRLAVCTPFSGKAWALDRWLGALREAGLPEGTQLLWLCNSPDEDFRQRLGDASNTMVYPVTLWDDFTYSTCPDGRGDKDGTVRHLYRELRKQLPPEAETIVTLEDDVLPEPGALSLLAELSRQNPSAEIGGVVPHRGRPHFGSPAGFWVLDLTQTADDGSHFIFPKQVGEVDEVTTVAFGMTAFSRQLFDRLPLTRDPQRRMWWGFDRLVSEDVRRFGGRVLAAWGARSQHMEHPPIPDAPTRAAQAKPGEQAYRRPPRGGAIVPPPGEQGKFRVKTIRHPPRDLDHFRAGNTDPRQNERHAEARKRRGHESPAKRAWRGIRP